LLSSTGKLIRLLAMLGNRPSEFYDRVGAMLDVHLEPYWHRRPDYAAVDWNEAVGGLNRVLGSRVEDYLEESGLLEIQEQVGRAINNMPSDAPFKSIHNGDFNLGRLCYAAVRIKRPTVVVETGVCYGVTSSFILKALQVNGAGRLFSIDLPPLGDNADDFVGLLIPRELRSCWQLHRGSSRQVLPQVLSHVGGVDLFVHDSLHTYRNMRHEFRLVEPHLTPGAVVVADDIEDNSAFQEWISKVQPGYAAVIREKAKLKALLGVAIFPVATEIVSCSATGADDVSDLKRS
jgi:Methyltransferase domain